MKLRGPIFFSVMLITLLVAAFYPKVDSPEKDAVLMRAILTFVGQLHYQPKQMNDAFSEKLYDMYLDRIDSGRRFLTQKDIEKLEKYKKQLDDQALAGNFEFFNLSLELLNNGMKKTQGFYREILAQPFEFTSNETVELDGEKRNFSKDDAALKDYWRRYLKYEVMMRVADQLEEQKNAKDAEGGAKSTQEMEAEARKEVLKLMDDWYDRLNKLKRSTRLSYYLNTITNLYDPHSDYLEPIDKQNFDIRFSGRLEGIGATLQTVGDNTKVSSIVVGGPAWKGKELQENDLILKVAQGDNGDWKDLTGMIVDDVVQLVRGEKGTKVRLTIKKVDGSIKEISIIRDIVILEEGFAKSLILDGASQNEKIGYIYLPRFYADFEHADGRFSAKDIAEELDKLKKEKVDGIILDLRNNGGGSLNDVVQMSGYFVEQGPIVQVKSKAQNPDVLDDTDPRVQYGGPLIVMVNHFSASASEILAAALQDYGRAVIVGTNTYGKGTVQRFYDLDRGIRGFEELKPLGEIKLTVQKFYRINGGSTQLRGVTPDIVLPDNYSFIEIGEKEEDYPLEWTEIAPLQYKQNVYSIPNINKIKAESQKRVANNPIFQQVVENAKRLKARGDETSYPLQLEAYLSMSEKRQAESRAYEDLFKNIVNKGVRNLSVDIPSIHADESKEARNDDFKETVSKDVYINETLMIMHDLIKNGVASR